MNNSLLPTFYKDLDNISCSQEYQTIYTNLSLLLRKSKLADHFSIYYSNGYGFTKVYRTHEEPDGALDTLHTIPATAHQIWPGVVAFPLEYQTEAFGILVLWDISEITTNLAIVAQTVATSLINVQLYQDAQQLARNAQIKIEKVHVISELLKNLPLDVLLSKLMDMSLAIMKAQVGSIVLYRDGELHSEIELGLRGDFLLNITTTSDDSTPYVESVIKNGEAIFMNHPTEFETLNLGDGTESLSSLICVPLQTNTRKLGALSIANSEGELDRNDFEVLTTISKLCSASIENSLLQEAALTAQRMQSQLSIAADIQNNLHATEAPQVSDIEIDGWCIPCDETGGDYYDFLTPENGEVGVIIGDASGHGLPAALTMVGVRSSLLTVLTDSSNLCTAFTKVNARAYSDSDNGTFMTLFAGFFSPDRRSLHYCCAGHDLPLWYRPSIDSFVPVEGHTDMPIGVKPDVTYTLQKLEDIRPGDILIFGTDGIWEAFNEAQKAFDIEGLKQCIQAHASLPAPFLSKAIRNAVLNHIGKHPRTDDITLVVTRVS